MKNKLIVWAILALSVLLLPFSAQAAPNQTQDPNLLANNTPAQLIEFWDDASQAERSAIQELLFENISEATPILRNKIITGTRKQKLLACVMVAEMQDMNSVPILIEAIDDPDEKIKTRAIVSLKKLRAGQAANKIRQQIPKAKNKGLIKASLATLGILGGAQDIPNLRTYLSDPDESIRVNAAAALALLGN